uniref:Uncharacterized protein n=1 Tax=Onchocerca volvulus TaxID=6282 RepID=A0A8R1XRL8_ONCVO
MFFYLNRQAVFSNRFSLVRLNLAIFIIALEDFASGTWLGRKNVKIQMKKFGREFEIVGYFPYPILCTSCMLRYSTVHVVNIDFRYITIKIKELEKWVLDYIPQKFFCFERSLLSQAAWNCDALEAGNIIFEIFKEIVIPLNVFINCYFIFICAVLQTVHFIYSKEARNIIKEHLNNLRITQLKNKIIAIRIKT